MNRTRGLPISATILCFYAAIILIGGCAVMSKNDCLESNWFEAGNNDAMRGHRSAARFESRTKVCARHGASPDQNEYLNGYREGLQHYCRPEQGFRAGVQNHTYRGICPVEMESSYLKNYITGLQKARRDAWLSYQWVDSKLFDVRIRRSNADDDDTRRRRKHRIERLTSRRDELRAKQQQIKHKIAFWSKRLQN